MPWIIDLLLVFLFTVAVLLGYRKGFLRTVLGFGRLVASIILTYTFGRPFSMWLDRQFIHPGVYDGVRKKLTELAASSNGDTAAFLDGLPARYRVFMSTSDLTAPSDVDELVAQIAPTVSAKISLLLSTVIGYVLLFVLLYLVISLAVRLVGKLADLPIIRVVDRFLGAAVGVINGVLLTCFVGTVLYGVVYLTGKIGLYEQSIVFKFLYDLQLFSRIFRAIL